jgi:hypothetical protein
MKKAIASVVFLLLSACKSPSGDTDSKVKDVTSSDANTHRAGSMLNYGLDCKDGSMRIQIQGLNFDPKDGHINNLVRAYFSSSILKENVELLFPEKAAKVAFTNGIPTISVYLKDSNDNFITEWKLTFTFDGKSEPRTDNWGNIVEPKIINATLEYRSTMKNLVLPTIPMGKYEIDKEYCRSMEK